MAELEKQNNAQAAQIETLQKQAEGFADRTLFLGAHFAAWQQFIAANPAIQYQWEVFEAMTGLGNNPQENPVFVDTNWPLSAKNKAIHQCGRCPHRRNLRHVNSADEDTGGTKKSHFDFSALCVLGGEILNFGAAGLDESRGRMVAAEGLEPHVLELGDRGVYVAGVGVKLGGELICDGQEWAGVSEDQTRCLRCHI